MILEVGTLTQNRNRDNNMRLAYVPRSQGRLDDAGGLEGRAIWLGIVYTGLREGGKDVGLPVCCLDLQVFEPHTIPNQTETQTRVVSSSDMFILSLFYKQFRIAVLPVLHKYWASIGGRASQSFMIVFKERLT